MTNQTLQTVCWVIAGACAIGGALAVLDANIFGQKAQRDRQIAAEQKVAEQTARKANVGRLETERKLILSSNQQVYPKLEFGDSSSILVYTGPQGGPFFEIAEDNNIIIEIEDDQVKISTKIINSEGKIVAEIVKNEWKVNPSNSWDRNYSKNALEVKAPSGDILLQVKLVEDRVQFQAKLHDATGRGIAFVKCLGPDGKWGGCMEFTGPNNPELSLKIQPIFKYPSELHLGEFVN